MTYTIEQIEQRLAEITPGEWLADGIGTDWWLVSAPGSPVCGRCSMADAQFIAEAPQIVCWLVAENKRLREVVLIAAKYLDEFPEMTEPHLVVEVAREIEDPTDGD